jgi:hypothetical protein
VPDASARLAAYGGVPRARSVRRREMCRAWPEASTRRLWVARKGGAHCVRTCPAQPKHALVFAVQRMQLDCGEGCCLAVVVGSRKVREPYSSHHRRLDVPMDGMNQLSKPRCEWQAGRFVKNGKR